MRNKIMKHLDKFIKTDVLKEGDYVKIKEKNVWYSKSNKDDVYQIIDFHNDSKYSNDAFMRFINIKDYNIYLSVPKKYIRHLKDLEKIELKKFLEKIEILKKNKKYNL